jgi:hypothetical protein
MTIDQLENYRANKVELSAITEEIEGSEEVIGVQSAAKFPYAVHTVTQSGIPGTPANVRLLERQHSRDAACKAVENYVEQITDDKIRAMIRLKYMRLRGRDLTWLEIAVRFGYTDEGTPRKKIRQYVQNDG